MINGLPRLVPDTSLWLVRPPSGGATNPLTESQSCWRYRDKSRLKTACNCLCGPPDSPHWRPRCCAAREVVQIITSAPTVASHSRFRYGAPSDTGSLTDPGEQVLCLVRRVCGHHGLLPFTIPVYPSRVTKHLPLLETDLPQQLSQPSPLGGQPGRGYIRTCTRAHGFTFWLSNVHQGKGLDRVFIR